MAETTLGKSVVEGTSAGALAVIAAAPFVEPNKAAAIGAAVTLAGMAWKAVRDLHKKSRAPHKRRRMSDIEKPAGAE